MNHDVLDRDLVDDELLASGIILSILLRFKSLQVLEDHIVVGFAFFLIQINFQIRKRERRKLNRLLAQCFERYFDIALAKVREIGALEPRRIGDRHIPHRERPAQEADIGAAQGRLNAKRIRCAALDRGLGDRVDVQRNCDRREHK
ncbi:MAG: hypothetical protein IIA64_12030 [Planctomycetes bacterium]|nr:hypothetical protein [Planctomycetota bacterium]